MNTSYFPKKRIIASLFVNGIIFLSTLVIAWMGITQGAGEGQVGSGVIGLGYLIPYTMDSNIISGIAALVLFCCSIRSLRTGADITPRWAVILQLTAATCLGVTFITAAVFLAPMKAMMGAGYFSMFREDMFHFHFLNPLLSFVSFIFLQQGQYGKKTTFIGMIPTVIYSFVYLFMVVILKRWSDFYNFTLGGRYAVIPLVFIVIYSFAFLSARLLIRLHNRHQGIILQAAAEKKEKP